MRDYKLVNDDMSGEIDSVTLTIDSGHKQSIPLVADNTEYQNYLDFPVLVKEKDKLNFYLLKNGIEARLKHYYNCGKILKI